MSGGRAIGNEPIVIFFRVIDRSRGARDEEQVCRYTRPLIGLEHAIGEAVPSGDVEIGLNRSARIVYEPVCRVLWLLVAPVVQVDGASAIHLANLGLRVHVAGVHEVAVPVPNVPAGNKGNRGQLYGLAKACDLWIVGGNDIDSRLEGGIASEQVVKTAIFLDNHNYVLNFCLSVNKGAQ